MSRKMKARVPQSVVLMSDVPGLGQLGDVKSVKDGYSRNYLIPNKLAVFASADVLKRLEKQKEKIEAKRSKQLNDSKSVADKIAKVGLVFERPVGPGGRLFGSVTPFDVVSEIAKYGVALEKKSVLMHAALKTVGDHTVSVRLHSQVAVSVPVKIIGLEVKSREAAEAAEAAAASSKDQSAVPATEEAEKN
jgi:large subunit ribosomal protein L9